MRIIKRIIPIFIIIGVAAFLFFVPDIAPEKYMDLATLFRIEQQRQGMEGYSTSAVSKGKVMYVDGFGQDISGKKLTKQSTYAADSLEGLVYSLATLSLVREGALDLSTPLADLVTPPARSSQDTKLLDIIVRKDAVDSPWITAREPVGDLLGTVLHTQLGNNMPRYISSRVLAPFRLSRSSEVVLGSSKTATQGSGSFYTGVMPWILSDPGVEAKDPRFYSTSADAALIMAALFDKRSSALFLRNSAIPPISQATQFSRYLGFRHAAFGNPGVLSTLVSRGGTSSFTSLWPDEGSSITIFCPQSSLLISYYSLPAIATAARDLMVNGSADRLVPLGRIYILLAVIAVIHILMLSISTGGASTWARHLVESSEAKNKKTLVYFGLVRSILGIPLRIVIAFAVPIVAGLILKERLSWIAFCSLEPGLAAWFFSGLMMGLVRNAARLVWLISKLNGRNRRLDLSAASETVT